MSIGEKIEMTGEKYGRLTVVREKDISEYPNHKRRCVQWYCRCDCGTQDVIVDGVQLRRGHVRSCGCYNREMSTKKNTVDISGNKYGKLTVVKQVPKPDGSKTRGSWWLCNCECGREVIIKGNALKSGGTSSCGCSISKGELLIRNLLNDNDVNFKTQYTFKDCRSEITNWLLKFDFAVFTVSNQLSFLIEYDGQQHYSGNRFSSSKEVNEQKFIRTQRYDIQKSRYCKNHGIDILRIPYWEYKNIEEIITNKLKSKGVI